MKKPGQIDVLQLMQELDSMPGELAWGIFTKGIWQKEALANSKIKGKGELEVKVFGMLAVMA